MTVFKSLATNISLFTTVANSGIGAAGALSVAFSALKATIVSFLVSPAGIALGTVAAIAMIAGIVDFTTESLAEAQKKAEESKEAYETEVAAVEELNAELATTRDRIDELEAKEHLSLVEEEELNNLRLQNDYLAKQVDYREKIRNIKLEEATADAINAVENKSEKVVANTAGNNAYEIYEDIDRITAAENTINKLKESQQELDDIYRKQASIDNIDSKEYKANDKRITKLTEEIKREEQYLASLLESLDVDMETLLDPLGNAVLPIAQPIVDRYKALQQLFAGFESEAEATVAKINGILEKVEFSGMKDSLIKAAKLDKYTLENEITPELRAVLDESGIYDDFIQHIMALANPDSLNIPSITEQIMEKFEASNADIDWDTFLSENLGSEDLVESLHKWIEETNIDTSTWETIDWIEGVKKAVAYFAGEVEDVESVSFSSLFEKDKEPPENFTEYINQYITEFDSLKSIKEQMKSGEFDLSKSFDVLKDIPELTGHTNSLKELQDAVENLTFDKLREFIAGYNKHISDLTDPKEISVAQEYLRNIVRNYTDTYSDEMQNISKSDWFKNIGFDASYRGSQGMNADLNEIWSEFGDTEKGREVLATLSLDPTAASWTYEQWVENIENEEVYVELKLRDESIAKADREIQRIQNSRTKAKNNQELKQAQGFDLTATDYSELIGYNNEELAQLEIKIAETAAKANIKGLSDAAKSAYESELAGLEAEKIELVTDNVNLRSEIDDRGNVLADRRVDKLNREKDSIIRDQEMKQTNGEDLQESDYQELIDKNKEIIAERETQLRIAKAKMNDVRRGEAEKENLEAEAAGYESEIAEYEKENAENQKAIDELPKTRLQNALKVAQNEADVIKEEFDAAIETGDRITAEKYKNSGLEQYYKQQETALNDLISTTSDELDALDYETQSAEWLTKQEELMGYKSQLLQLKQTQEEYNQAVAEAPLLKLQDDMSKLESEASKLESAMSLNEAKGVKPLLGDYRALLDNNKQQIKNLQNQNSELLKQQQTLDPLNSKYLEIQSQIDSNVLAIDEARAKQIEWNEAAAQLNYDPNEGLMAYNKAKGTRNAGDNYLDMLEAAKEAQEAWNNGLIGTDDFKTAAKMFSPNGMDDAANWKENYGNITRYFTEDVSGVKNFLNDLEEEQLAAQDAMGNWSYNIDDIQGSADALGISFEAFLAVMGRLQDYGFTNDFFSSIEDGQDHIADLYVDLYEAEATLSKLKEEQAAGDETVTDTVLTAQEARINQIKQSILESQDLLDQLVAKSAQDYEQEYAGKMSSLVQRLGQADEIQDDGARKSYIEKIKDWAESESIDISELFTADGDIIQSELDKLTDQYQVDLSFSTEEAEKAAEELGKTITSAMEDSESEVKPLVDSLAQYTNEQFANITFGDGSYEEGALGEAERTIDHLLTTLGLSQEQAQFLLQILGELGYIEYTPEVNTEGVATGVQEATANAQSEANSNPVIIPMKTAPEGSVPTIAETVEQTFRLTGNNTEAKESVDEAKEYGDEQESTMTVTADTDPALSEVDTLVQTINKREATLKVKANTEFLKTSINNVLTNNVFSMRVQAKVSGLPPANAETQANGTFRVAHANGTAYNVLNLRSAYADGSDVAIQNDENALMNELGQESIVRDGKWYLVPGGAHMESLKKGDIIFNHKQTEELLKHGHVASGNGHGRVYGSAYANGTAYHGMPAHSNNYGNFQGGLDSSSASPSTSAVSATNNNTTALKAHTDATKDNTKATEDQLKAFDDYISKLKDWIEVLIQRNEESKELNLTKADNQAKATDKNKYVDRALTDVKDLIEANMLGAVEYEAQAKKVKNKAVNKKLITKEQANEIIPKIHSGNIKIEEYDEGARKFIEEYSEWYDKAQACKQSVEDLKLEQKELAQTKFDNIATEYDNIISRIEHTGNLLNTAMENQELKGHITSARYYQALINNTKDSQFELMKKQKDLEASLEDAVASGKIEEGSTEWYEMQGKIDGVIEKIKEADNEILKYQNDIRKTNWEIEDMKHEAVTRLTDEGDFLIELLSNNQLFDDKGNITNDGMAVSGLNMMNYEIALDEAEAYADEWKDLQKQIKEKEANGDYDLNLINRANEVRDAWQNASLSVDKYAEAIRDLKDKEFQAQLDALKELSDKYMDVLKKQKDMRDYQDEVSEKTADISRLEKMKLAYSRDTSEEGRLKRQQVDNDLEEARKALEETQYDRFIADQEEILTDLEMQTQEFFEARLLDITSLLAEAGSDANANQAAILGTIQSEVQTVGADITTELKTIWDTKGPIVTEIGGATTAITDQGTLIVTAVGGVTTELGKLIGQDGAIPTASGSINTSLGNQSKDFDTTFNNKEGALYVVLDGIRNKIEDYKKKSDEEGKKGVKEAGGNDDPNYDPNQGNNNGNDGKNDGDTVKNVGDKINEEDKLTLPTVNLPKTNTQKDKQGDGKIQVGDKVTFTSGRYYENSYGQGNSGYHNRGKKVYITKIHKGNPYPYHISTGKKLGKGDLGWLKKSQLKGYASGIDKVKEDEWAITQEKGREIIALPDGSIMAPLKKGSGVINNAKTEQLLSLANNHDAIMDMMDTTNKLNQAKLAEQIQGYVDAICGLTQHVNNSMSSGSANYNGDIIINLPNIQKPEDFMNWLRNNSKAQHDLQDVVFSEVMGKGKLSTRKK